MPSTDQRLRYWKDRAQKAEKLSEDLSATLLFTLPALRVLRTMLAKANLNIGALKADEVMWEVKRVLGVKETDDGEFK